MAEFGVAVSMVPPGVGWSEGVVAIDGGTSVPAVSSGPPLAGYQAMVDAAYAGEIALRGPSLGHGLSGVSLSDADGWYRTGDIWAVLDGEVSVIGRIGEGLVVNGHQVLVVRR